MIDPVRILIVSTPVGPLGSGVGGGVELNLHSLVYGLGGRGHHVEILAPEGSLLVGTRLHQIPGDLQRSSQLLGRSAPVELPPDSVLAAMWRRVRELEGEFDVVVNLAYDWLPLYLTPFLDVPVVHLVSMGSLNDAMDDAIRRVATETPGRLAAHSRAQTETFPDPDVFTVVGGGVVTERYDVRATPEEPRYLGYVGRLSPEKGLDDVAAVSARSGLPVRVWGLMQDEAYWRSVRERHPGAVLEYRGFLPTDDLQADIGGCTAVLMTPKWVEAFGLVAVEAMATGVPVITYDRGGPAEIVDDGHTGFVVPPDDIDAMVAAVRRIDEIDRRACRARVEHEFSTDAYAERVERWLVGALERAAATR